MNGEYVIRGRSFPMVQNVSLGDAMFIEAAARMEFEEFAARMDSWRERADDEQREMEPGDLRVLAGLLAAAVSRQERDWAPMKVARFVWDIDVDTDLEIIPPEKVEADAVPLTEPEEETPSEPSSNGSTISAADSPAGVPV